MRYLVSILMMETPAITLLANDLSGCCRPEDLRLAFERFGPVKDVYLPKDYYSGYVCSLKSARVYLMPRRLTGIRLLKAYNNFEE